MEPLERHPFCTLNKFTTLWPYFDATDENPLPPFEQDA